MWRPATASAITPLAIILSDTTVFTITAFTVIVFVTIGFIAVVFAIVLSGGIEHGFGVGSAALSGQALDRDTDAGHDVLPAAGVDASDNRAW